MNPEQATDYKIVLVWYGTMVMELRAEKLLVSEGRGQPPNSVPPNGIEVSMGSLDDHPPSKEMAFSRSFSMPHVNPCLEPLFRHVDTEFDCFAETLHLFC